MRFKKCFGGFNTGMRSLNHLLRVREVFSYEHINVRRALVTHGNLLFPYIVREKSFSFMATHMIAQCLLLSSGRKKNCGLGCFFRPDPVATTTVQSAI